MGTIYRKYCDKCDADSAQDISFDGFAGAAITNNSEGGKIISEGYLALLNPAGMLIPLPHPIESSALHQQGETWSGATRTGRILRVTNLICSDCGAMNTTADLSASAYGCGFGLILSIGLIAANTWYLKLPVFIASLMIWAGLILPHLMIDAYLRMRFRANVRPFRFKRCTCGSRKAISIARAGKKLFPCKRCGEKSVRIEIAGRS